MSDNWIKFVPSDPAYRPSRPAAEKARVLLAMFVPQADEVNVVFNDTVEFIHPYGNWSGVKCSSCGADAEKWWHEAMESAAKNDFLDLHVTTACCGARVSLNELTYVWPAAFASFVLEAMNPNVKDVTAVQMQQLAICLGCELRRIWVHL